MLTTVWRARWGSVTMVLALGGAGVLGRLAPAAGEPVPTRPGVIRQIDIVVTRANPSVIRNELTFREGEPLAADKLEESRQNLHRLGLLKSLAIEPQWDAALDGYKVTVKADDGWFFMPVPMAGSRGGERFASLMLMERNYFRHSEGLMLLGSYAEGQPSVMASLFLPHAFLMGGGQRSRLDEFAYADGAYNAKQFDDDLQHEQPEDFGAITNRYQEDVDKVYVVAGRRLTPWLQASAGLSFSSVAYHDAEFAPPDDAGDFNAWTLAVNLGKPGRRDPATQVGFFGALGRVFGLGMAEVKDSLQPLPQSETTRALRLSLERGETWLGSDAAYKKSLLTAEQVTLFRDYSVLTLALKGGWGADLPPSQLFATGQRGILAGVYAREYRGDEFTAAVADFSRPFFRSTTGVLNAGVFADSAVVWADDARWDQTGAGVNLAYRFWRFPLPIGGGATYSLDDRNWQFSFAVGGMF